MLAILNPYSNALALKDLCKSLRRYRELLWEMTRRDLVERYAGEVLGGAWAIAQPLLVMFIYTFVFTFIFKLRLNADGGSQYVAYLLAALAPWLAMQDIIGRSPTLIVDSSNLVKQIVFPAEILPLKMVLASTITLAIGLAFPMIIGLSTGSAKPVWWLLLPFPVLCHLMLLAGIAYMLSAATVFVRDLKNIVQLLLMIGLFAHPILYAPNMLPPWADAFFYLSPLSHILWIYRDIIVYGEITHPLAWFLAPFVSAFFFISGYRVFRHLSHYFGDAL